MHHVVPVLRCGQETRDPDTRGPDTNSESARKDDKAEVGNDDMEVEAAADQPELHGAMDKGKEALSGRAEVNSNAMDVETRTADTSTEQTNEQATLVCER